MPLKQSFLYIGMEKTEKPPPPLVNEAGETKRTKKKASNIAKHKDWNRGAGLDSEGWLDTEPRSEQIGKILYNRMHWRECSSNPRRDIPRRNHKSGRVQKKTARRYWFRESHRGRNDAKAMAWYKYYLSKFKDFFFIILSRGKVNALPFFIGLRSEGDNALTLISCV